MAMFVVNVVVFVGFFVVVCSFVYTLISIVLPGRYHCEGSVLQENLPFSMDKNIGKLFFPSFKRGRERE